MINSLFLRENLPIQCFLWVKAAIKSMIQAEISKMPPKGVIKPTRHELSVNKYKLPENNSVPMTIKLADINMVFERKDWLNKATMPKSAKA